MKRAAPLVLTLLAAALAPLPVRPAGRHLAIIVDTSGSMETNDRQRYTLQLSQILSDLVDDGDTLHVIRMPGGLFISCFDRPSSALVLQLDPASRARFKRQLDSHLAFNTGTEFAAPVRTAISLLSSDPRRQRMLLVIADSGGLGACEGGLTRELQELRRGGTSVAAINLGGTAGAFDANPAFDFTTPALDAQGLIEAVALVYQRFLGAKKVQTGRVSGEIGIDIAPYVNEAFLVVAADGPIGAAEPLPGHPGAAEIDADHRGGGQSTGLDGRTRGYRIVRLKRPQGGRWRFRVPGLRDPAGWMLLQDSAVGVRLVSSPSVPRGVSTPLEVELYDQTTGKKITGTIPGLQVTLDIDGKKVTFRDDGQGGDRQPGDGILTAPATFDKVGKQPLAVHIQSDFLDRTVPLTAEVLDAAWRLDVQTPARAEVDRAMELAVRLQPLGSAALLRAPERIDARAAGSEAVALRDDGQGKDRQAGDRIFTGVWTPRQTGRLQVEYQAAGGSATPRAAGMVEVLGRLRLGRPAPIRLGRATSGTEAPGQLDLGTAEVRGQFDVRVSTPFRLKRTALEIDPGTGWVPLGREPVVLQLASGRRHAWPVRLRVGECPEGNPAGRTAEVVVEGTGGDGQPVRASVLLEVEVVPDPWLHCWWPVLALGLVLVAAGIVTHGYWAPSRFAPRLGVVLSPEADMGEGFFYPIRGQRGSRSGFYRDAHIFVCQDYRLSGRPRNAVARLRADRKQVRIQATPGAVVWKQNAEGVWEQLSAGESTARFGDIYKNDPGTLFFELRNP